MMPLSLLTGRTVPVLNHRHAASLTGPFFSATGVRVCQIFDPAGPPHDVPGRNRGSYMNAHVLLNLLKGLGK